MGRNALNPNVEAPPRPHTRATEWSSPILEAEREAVRADNAAASAALSELMPAREADARREVPRLRMDAANPNKARALRGPDVERRMLSSNMKKDLAKSKRGWVETLPKVRRQAVQRVVGSRENLEGINQALNSTVGVKSDLPPAVRRRVEAVDRAISDFERTNEREHIVYSMLMSPRPHGNSRNALRARLLAMSESNDATLTFDSYIPATHSLGNVAESPDIVMEIRTRSGAYLGSSDTRPDADHIVGRGRTLRPVGVHEVSYVREDGTRGTRTIVQMDDVTPNP